MNGVQGFERIASDVRNSRCQAAIFPVRLEQIGHANCPSLFDDFV